MAENGVKTTFLDRASVIDSVIGNKDGSTSLVPLSDLARQLAGLGVEGTDEWLLAQKFAENPEDDPVLEGQFSALHHAAKANIFSISANLAAGESLSSSTAAGAHELSAELSAAEAKTSALASALPPFASVAQGVSTVSDLGVFSVFVDGGIDVYRRDDTDLVQGAEKLGPLIARSYQSASKLAGSEEGPRGTGAIWQANENRYEEAAPDATDHILTTVGGVKLYALNRKSAQPRVVDILIPYGQSDAQGQPASTLGALSWITPKAEMYNGTAVVPLTNSMPTPNSGTFGGSAWPSFANEYAESTGRHCVFANCAKGSQSIADLSKGAGNNNYTSLIAWHDATVAAIEARGDIVGDVYILFNQGQRDQTLKTNYQTYYAAIDQLWADIKADTLATKMLVWPLGLYLASAVTGAWAVQMAQRQFCAKNTDVILAYDGLGGFNESNGLSDGTHNTMPGYNLMGREGAKTLVGVLFDNGTEGPHLPALNGTLAFSSFQRQQSMCATISKNSSGIWAFNNTTGPSASFVGEIDATSSATELRIKCPAPIKQFLRHSAHAGADSVKRGISVGTRVNYDTDDNADDYLALNFVIAEMPVRVNMGSTTVDAGILGSFSTLAEGISGNFTATGRCTITHPPQLGLPSGEIRGGAARGRRVNSSGETTTFVDLYDASGAFVNDECAVFLKNMQIPHADMPVGSSVSFELVFSTYVT